MTSLTSRIQALRDVCEGVLTAEKQCTRAPWMRDGQDIWHQGRGYMPDEMEDPHLFTGITSHPKLQNSPSLKGNIEFACLSRTITPQFARATLKTLDWLEADMKEGDPLALAYELHRDRLESILSEFGI